METEDPQTGEKEEADQTWEISDNEEVGEESGGGTD